MIPEKLIIFILIFSLFSCQSSSRNQAADIPGKTNPAVSYEPYEGEHYELLLALKEYIDSPKLDRLFSHPDFTIYERVASAQRSYNQITVEFYKRPQFGLFTDAGIRAGRRFVEDNYEALTRAADEFNIGYDAIWDISALAGIEYSWGRMRPRHRAFNALVSLYRDVPARRTFAINNIRGLLRAIEDPFIEIDPFAPSSFVGAVGYCQLMPFWFTTILDWRHRERLDGNNDGVFDPYDMDDAIQFFAWRLSDRNYTNNRFDAIKRYNGSGSAARAFAEAVIEFSGLIKSGI